MIKLYIHKQEAAFNNNIQAGDTEKYGRENKVPDSDELAMMMFKLKGRRIQKMRGRQKGQDQRQCPPSQCHPYPLISIGQKELD